MAVMNFILQYMKINRCAPTNREIGERFGFASPNAAADHVRALERKGWVLKRPGTHRNLIPT